MKIYWDIQNHKFLTGISSLTEFDRFNWTLRDQVAIELYIVTPDDATESYTQQEAPTGYAAKLGIKNKAALASDPLASVEGWTLVGSGSSAYYTATLDLNTTELIAAVAAGENSDKEYDCWAEFTLVDASNKNRDSTKIDCRITEDVNRSSDAPAASAAGYPWREEFTDPVTGALCWRFQNSLGETMMILKPMGA